MCLDKKYIRNRKIDPSGIDKPQCKVPCGRCPECAKQKSDDWFVRSYFEIFGASTPKDCFLVTLDFDNDHLPLYKVGYGLIQDASGYHQAPYKRFEDFDKLPDNIVPCFDNEEIRKFLDRIKYYLPPFRYLCVAEYGGFLSRPHHHMLFIFDKWQLMTMPFLLYAVSKSWRCGEHQHISCGNNPLQMIKYIVPYVTKDFSFDLDKKEQLLPYRFRPRVMASGQYGASALGNQITFDTIKNCGFVVIDGIKYQIPRYYEQKLCYDYTWSPIEKKAYRPLNDNGKELNALRHTKHIVHYVKSFFASRFEKIHLDTASCEVFKELYPLSPYNGMQWRDIVYDAMSDYQLFVDYVRYKDFVYTQRSHSMPKNQKYKKYAAYRPWYPPYDSSYVFNVDTGHNVRLHGFTCRSNSEEQDFDFVLPPSMDLVSQACFLYDLYNMKQSERKLFIALYKESEKQKKRAWANLKNNPGLARYLRLKNFDFKKLYHMSYRDYYELNNSKRVQYVQFISTFQD